MSPLKSLFVAVPVAVGLLAAPAAHAEWRGDRGGHGGWHGPERHGYWHGDRGHGPGVAGALIGLGAAAIVGGVLASQVYAPPPRVVYAPPPVYMAPPPVVYAPPPVVYAPPPPPGYGY